VTTLSTEVPAVASGRVSGRLAALSPRELEAERDRWPLFVPIFPGIGIALYFALRQWNRRFCDLLGCIYRASGQIAALVQSQDALDDDCATAAIVIATVPAEKS